MPKTFAALGLALFALSATRGLSAPGATLSLDATAARDGYVLHWLLPTRSVGLFRPGLAIVLRPGVTMYDVNNRVEFADIPPVYVNGDMRISHALASRLAKLASMAASARNRTAYARSAMTAPNAQAAGTGPMTVSAQWQPGSEALSVTGHAPSSAPVTITLLATISSDLPTVVVSRQDTIPDVNGNFQTQLPIAPAYERGMLLRVLATSAAGSAPASAPIIVGPPNAGETVPLESQPQDP
jgi:hypothetical protein